MGTNHKGRVLVVDDLPDVLATVSGMLSDANYAICPASGMSDALEILKKEKIDVAVLDIRLDNTNEDNQDGIVLMHEIKKWYPRISTIILTGYADVKVVREALQPGPDGTPPAFGFLEKTEISNIAEYVERALMHSVRKGSLLILDMIQQGENEHVEFKSSIRWDYKSKSVHKGVQEAIVIAIAGIMNGQGGTLLIGVSDSGEVLGIEKDISTLTKRDKDGFQLALSDIVRTYLGVEHVSQLHPHIETVDGKQICAVKIDKSSTPVFYSKGDENKFWVRTGNSTRYLDVKSAMNYIETNWKKAS